MNCLKQTNCLMFVNAMNNATIINTFNSFNSNIAKTKIHNCQIMTAITNRILKFEPMIKIPILTNYTLFTIINFSRINSFT